MKNLWFFAAAVLFCAQVLQAGPTSTVTYSSRSEGTKTVTTSSSSSSSKRSGQTTTEVKSSSSSSGNVSGNYGQDGQTATTTAVKSSSSGKRRDKDNDKDRSNEGCEKSGKNDDNGKVKVTSVQSGHTKTTNVEKSSSASSGNSRNRRDDGDDDDKKSCSHDKSGEGKNEDKDNDKRGADKGNRGNSKERKDKGNSKERKNKGKSGERKDHGRSGERKNNGKSGERKDNGNSKERKNNGKSGERKDNGNSKERKNNGKSGERKDNGNSKERKNNGKSGERKDNGNSKERKNNGRSGERKDGNWHTERHVEKHGNNCDVISKQLEAANAEIVLLKSQLHKSSNDFSVLQTTVNQITIQSQSWKSKFESTSITLQQVQEINIKLEFNLKQTQTTIITLQNNIQQITTSAKSNEKELMEWKHKYGVLVVDSDTCKKNGKDLTTSNADLKKSVKEVTDKLTTCQTSSNQLSIDVITIKANWEVTKKSLGNCENEKAKLDQALKIQINEYNEDEKRDYEELLLRKKIEADLGHCRSQSIVMENNYKAEKTNALNCRNEIVAIRDDCKKSRNKYEIDIKNLQVSIDKYKLSVKTEIDLKNSCIIENKNYVLSIKDINNQLDLSRKAVIEAQAQNKRCQEEVNGLNVTVGVLKSTLTDTNNQLTICSNSSSPIQIELTTCKSNGDSYLRTIKEVRESLRISETKVVQLGSDNSALAAGKKQCEIDLSALRCDTNKYLETVRQSQAAIYQKMLQAGAIIDENNSAVKKFIVDKKIACPQA